MCRAKKIRCRKTNPAAAAPTADGVAVSLGVVEAVSTSVLVMEAAASAMTRVVAGWLGLKADAEVEVLAGLEEDVERIELLLDDSAIEDVSDEVTLRRGVSNRLM
jgi:hypothetical protein